MQHKIDCHVESLNTKTNHAAEPMIQRAIKACDGFGGAAQIGSSVYWIVDTRKFKIKGKE